VRAAQKVTRPKKVEVLPHYDDCERDLAGELARRLAEDAG
jgi:hypothetical protein